MSSARRDPLATDHLHQDLGRRSLRGGAIAFGSQGLRVIIQFAATILLARMLPPDAFGLIAMVAALTALLDLVKELGLSAATIQRPQVTQDQVSILFWINAAVGGAIAGLLFLAAPAIAGFYGETALQPVTQWLAAGFAVSGLTVQHWALLRRQMRFGAIALLETGAELAALCIAVAMAWRGDGYWALVAQRLTVPLIALAGSWLLCPWRPGLPRRTAGLGALIGFGASVTGYNLVTVAARSLDQILIGWLWGPVTLGLYERAARLVLVPVNNINAPLYAVAMPTLSRLDGDVGRYRTAFMLMFEKFAMITMPPAALAAVTADWVVGLLFGPHWLAATPYVACFSVAALSLPTMLAVGLLYQSQNRPRELLRAAVVDAVLVGIAILCGLAFGALGIAACYAAGGLLLRLPAAFWLAGRRGPVGCAALWGAVLPALLAAAAVAAGIGGLRLWQVFPALTPVQALLLAALVAAGIALPVFAALPRSRRALDQLWRLPRRLRGRPA